tara:strand:+ start:22960 stop:23310 length:351 start_codon:yes stop_codon:yes gene_type:complete
MKEPDYWFFEEDIRKYFFYEFYGSSYLTCFFQNATPLTTEDCDAILSRIKGTEQESYHRIMLKKHVKKSDVVYLNHGESDCAFPCLEHVYEQYHYNDGCDPVSYTQYLELIKEYGQ